MSFQQAGNYPSARQKGEKVEIRGGHIDKVLVSNCKDGGVGRSRFSLEILPDED